MEPNLLNNTPRLVQAVYMVSQHGLSISDIAETYQISKLALYRAVRAHNTSRLISSTNKEKSCYSN